MRPAVKARLCLVEGERADKPDSGRIKDCFTGTTPGRIVSEQQSGLAIIIIDGRNGPDRLEFTHHAPSPRIDVVKRTEQVLNIHQTGAKSV